MRMIRSVSADGNKVSSPGRAGKAEAWIPPANVGDSRHASASERSRVNKVLRAGRAQMRLDNKVALVTGGGSGFGKGIAETFAREGARVAVIDINEQAARATASAISNKAIAVGCDVSRRADVDAAVKATLNAFGTIDILVNNADRKSVV